MSITDFLFGKAPTQSLSLPATQITTNNVAPWMNDQFQSGFQGMQTWANQAPGAQYTGGMQNFNNAINQRTNTFNQ